MRGVERSEQNNPASCFANGDRRFLRDVTSDKTQNVEQKSRTIPLGFTPEIRTRVPSLFLVDPLMRGVELSEQNNPVSCFANGDRRFLRDVTSDKIRNVEQKSRTIPRGDTPEIRIRVPSFLVASPQASALVELATRIGVRILRARRWELAHVSREQKYSPKTKLPLS